MRQDAHAVGTQILQWNVDAGRDILDRDESVGPCSPNSPVLIVGSYVRHWVSQVAHGPGPRSSDAGTRICRHGGCLTANEYRLWSNHPERLFMRSVHQGSGAPRLGEGNGSLSCLPKVWCYRRHLLAGTLHSGCSASRLWHCGLAAGRVRDRVIVLRGARAHQGMATSGSLRDNAHCADGLFKGGLSAVADLVKRRRCLHSGWRCLRGGPSDGTTGKLSGILPDTMHKVYESHRDGTPTVGELRGRRHHLGLSHSVSGAEHMLY